MTGIKVKWGNTIQLPKVFLQKINWSEHDPVEVVLQNETIIIKKISNQRHRTTKERLEAFYGKDLQELCLQAESEKAFDWGKPQGKEIW